MSRKNSRGLTTVELVAALGVLVVLAAMAIPLKRWDDKRRREDELRMTLQLLRNVIDQYKNLVDEGKITQHDVDQKGYPRSLDELVDGVDVGNPQSGKTVKRHFLQKIPIDPITGTNEWGIRSYQDDWDATSWGGENVYDVYSLSEVKALDGTYYRDW